MNIETFNPFTETLEKSFPEESAEEVQAKIDAAHQFFSEFRETSIASRCDILSNASQLLLKQKDELARLITTEMGKPITEALAEIEKCARVCDYYAKNAEQFLANEQIDSDATNSYVSYEPLGIILAIMPWNFPFWQVFRFAAPALAAGNVCLLKHSPNVPQCALAIEEIFTEAGLALGGFTTLLVGVDQVKAIIEHEHVMAVTLTGSERAGAEVASVAGKNVKKLVLELGGSDPFIVLKDADLETAAEAAVFSRMLNAGQSCIAAKRFIVVEEVYGPFVELVVARIKALVVGDPMQPDTQVGPMARMDLLEKLEDQVSRTVDLGATVLIGGNRVEGNGFFYCPTVLTDINQEMPVFTEEVFGPVASSISAKDENEAIALANNTQYGLGASLWTGNLDRAEKLATQIQAGAVFINGMVKSDPRLPFGGIKRSGYGRELSQLGIREFVNAKTVWVSA
ncbi:MAG TPA: NAD-dependent succinate-semialdehyde dehydrogenase [Flavobacteriales bacterium]|nr:NAD-dependent succinate-semialdehyde dehydrogenase [Flavobacteriales bacterium]